MSTQPKNFIKVCHFSSTSEPYPYDTHLPTGILTCTKPIPVRITNRLHSTSRKSPYYYQPLNLINIPHTEKSVVTTSLDVLRICWIVIPFFPLLALLSSFRVFYCPILCRYPPKLMKLASCSVRDENVDFASFTETWLSDRIHVNVIHIPGYNIARKDRILDHHGGVCLYIKNSIAYQVLSQCQHPSLELLWVKARTHRLPRGITSIVFGIVYHASTLS